MCVLIRGRTAGASQARKISNKFFVALNLVTFVSSWVKVTRTVQQIGRFININCFLPKKPPGGDCPQNPIEIEEAKMSQI